MFKIITIFGFILLIWVLLFKRDKQVDQYLSADRKDKLQQEKLGNEAVNLVSLSNRTVYQAVEYRWNILQQQLGNGARLKILLFSAAILALGITINSSFLRFTWFVVLPCSLLIGWALGYRWLQVREQKQFDESFPDALNMLTSSLSAGESIGKGIVYVGDHLEGEVGREFKLMGERLKLGESVDEVFRKSCRRFPNANFLFFVITLRANIERGGQLKDVMSRLNRQMFESRAMERKKMALTSEARMSAKIVCLTPFLFLFLLQFLSPENYQFIMFEPAGRPLLAYLLVSEFLGVLVIWALMKKVR